MSLVVFANGDQAWYQHGKLHNDNDQPAIIRANGDRFWYQHGHLHRNGDQPAVIYADGRRAWCQHGLVHRDGDQPAVIDADGRQAWYQYNPHSVRLAKKEIALERHKISIQNKVTNECRISMINRACMNSFLAKSREK
jgi:hypothetical protein